MRYDSYQFGAFEGLDNRKELLAMFVRMGDGLAEMDAGKKRAKFLMSLISDSTGGLRGCPMQVTPCNAIQAYHQFVAITGCLDVDINVAAAKLQRAVR